MKRSPTIDDEQYWSNILDPILAPVTSLAGVGPKTAAALASRLRRDPVRCLDLVLLPPNGKIDTATEDDLVLRVGERIALDILVLAHRPARTAKMPFVIVAQAGGVELDLVFFKARAPWLAERFPLDAELRIVGRLDLYKNRYRIAHPQLDNRTDASMGTVLTYGQIAGIPRLKLSSLIHQAIERLPDLPEWLAADLLAQHGWPTWRQAMRALHLDVGPDALEAARRRLAFDEFLAFQLELEASRRTLAVHPALAIGDAGKHDAAFLAALPFKPTGDQTRAMREVRADLGSTRPMSRLLQGDVGSGKTLVAAFAMLQVAAANAQAVLMAPTELLARQHHRTLSGWFAPLGMEVGLLTGGEPAAAKRKIAARLASGELALAVGTHALFQDSVTFNRLALVIVDEQHRFGVAQRSRLILKAPEGKAAHLLAMSATPIPRSLLLALYGDMAVSSLREKPAGRLPIETRLIPAARTEEVIDGCGRVLEKGERIYWICPLIDADDETGSEDAVLSRWEDLANRFGAKVGVAHGRQSPQEREAALLAFSKGELGILVATTVVEVGVDVSEATIIVIESAERFGMAQLHQLRGRVGRGSRPSTCLLLYNAPLGRMAKRRLETLRRTEDGFVIADADMQLRGPGEVLGTRQSGLPQFRVADLERDSDLLSLSASIASRIEGGRPSDPSCDYIVLLRLLFSHMNTQSAPSALRRLERH